jgi:hypothetical protein
MFEDSLSCFKDNCYTILNNCAVCSENLCLTCMNGYENLCLTCMNGYTLLNGVCTTTVSLVDIMLQINNCELYDKSLLLGEGKYRCLIC